MTDYQTEERTKIRRHWVDQAISLAMQSSWEEAVKANRTILDLFPHDVDALNRLGRALTELGRYAEARESYRHAVERDPNNGIAQKNLARLSALNIESAVTTAHEKVDPRLFIAETGKSGVANLARLADRMTLAKMAVGDKVYLEVQGRTLMVKNARGDTLGYVEPKLSQRLIDLIQGGNQYAAAIMSLDESNVRVIIRETHQAPGLLRKVSFPSRGPDASAIRPYIKDTLLKYESDEEDDQDDEYGTEPDSDTEETSDNGDFEDDRSTD
jgi:hypothetical protein